MNELALFAGAGGGILAGEILGWETVCAVERDAYAAQVLAQRQNDRTLKPFPIWSDIESFDGTPWKGIVDVVSGGFPCQDISSARSNNDKNGEIQGIEGEKSGLWREMWRIIGEIRPQFAFIENSAMLTIRGLERVLCDLAQIGYDARWLCLSAANLGGEHVRPRIWILAYPHGAQCQGGGVPGRIHQEITNFGHPRWGKDKPGVDRTLDGMAYRVDRLRAIGNGQSPIVAATAFRILSGD